MNLSNDEVQQRAEADRREVDPPIQVETTMWSRAGQLDWWVKEGRNGGVALVVRTAVNGGSGLLIFVPQAAHNCDFSVAKIMSIRARTPRKSRSCEAPGLHRGERAHTRCTPSTRYRVDLRGSTHRWRTRASAPVISGAPPRPSSPSWFPMSVVVSQFRSTISPATAAKYAA
jgi:hypothetical protein